MSGPQDRAAEALAMLESQGPDNAYVMAYRQRVAEIQKQEGITPVEAPPLHALIGRYANHRRIETEGLEQDHSTMHGTIVDAWVEPDPDTGELRTRLALLRTGQGGHHGLHHVTDISGPIWADDYDITVKTTPNSGLVREVSTVIGRGKGALSTVEKVLLADAHRLAHAGEHR